MDTVSVAELKSRLSHYLREVRAGKSFTVTSRDIPVATLGPWEASEVDDLQVIEAEPDAVPLFTPLLKPLRRPLPDAVELLRRDRDDRDERLADIAREAVAAPHALADEKTSREEKEPPVATGPTVEDGE